MGEQDKVPELDLSPVTSKLNRQNRPSIDGSSDGTAIVVCPGASGIEDATYECEKGCGYRGTYDVIAAHEDTCTKRKQQVQLTKSSSKEKYLCEKGCGFRGTYDDVEVHEETCTNSRKRVFNIAENTPLKWEQVAPSTPAPAPAPAVQVVVPKELEEENGAARELAATAISASW